MTVIGAVTIDGWVVRFGTARYSHPLCTTCNNNPGCSHLSKTSVPIVTLLSMIHSCRHWPAHYSVKQTAYSLPSGDSAAQLFTHLTQFSILLLQLCWILAKLYAAKCRNKVSIPFAFLKIINTPWVCKSSIPSQDLSVRGSAMSF